MDITIIGTGNMARGIATRALAGGHGVTLLGTEQAKAEALAGGAPGRRPRAGRRRPALAVTSSCSPSGTRPSPTCSPATATSLRQGRRRHHQPGRPGTYAPLTVEAGSVAQGIAEHVAGAKVVKAFNTTFAGTLVEGSVAGTPLDVFVAGDDDEAKGVVAQLATDGGLRAIDVGPLALADQLEGAGYLNMAVHPAWAPTRQRPEGRRLARQREVGILRPPAAGAARSRLHDEGCAGDTNACSCGANRTTRFAALRMPEEGLEPPTRGLIPLRFGSTAAFERSGGHERGHVCTCQLVGRPNRLPRRAGQGAGRVSAPAPSPGPVTEIAMFFRAVLRGWL